MLIAVGIEVAGSQRCVRLNVIAEFDDLQFQTIFFSDLFDLFQNLGMRAAGGADLDGFVLGRHRCCNQTGDDAQACEKLD